MTVYGLTPEGLVIKSLTVLKEDLESDFRGAFGESVGSNPDRSIPAQTGMGQTIGIMSERFAELWEVAQAINSAMDPDKATDAAQDALCALTGTLREPEKFSTVTAVATGTPGTIIPIHKKAEVTGTLTEFYTLAQVTIAAVLPWFGAHDYLIGERVYNPTDDGNNVYQCIEAGTSAGSGGPNSGGDSGSDITDGTVHWMYIGSGMGAVDVDMQATDPGPLAAVSGSLISIKTPVSGWTRIWNILDATLGAFVESNAALRLRREDELQASVAAAAEAIRDNILKVDGVVSCTVFQNVTMITDGNGLPPKSVEVLVDGGDDDAVRTAVFLNVGAGIETYGSNVGTVTDSQGTVITIKFTRPTLKPVYLDITYTYDALLYPSTGNADVKAAIVAKGLGYGLGRDVTASAKSNDVFDVDGIIDVTSVKLSFAPSPTLSTTLAIGLREKATFDTGRITLHVSAATP